MNNFHYDSLISLVFLCAKMNDISLQITVDGVNTCDMGKWWYSVVRGA